MGHELRYYNSSGEEITERAWRELIRVPGYGRPKVHLSQDRSWMVRLSWIGVASTREWEPRVWLVETVRFGKAGSKSNTARSTTEDVAAPVWCRTYAEAVGAFNLAVLAMEE